MGGGGNRSVKEEERKAKEEVVRQHESRSCGDCRGIECRVTWMGKSSDIDAT